MPNTLRIKRRASGSPGAPSSLANAELAYNEVDDVLYYGKGTGGAGGTATTIPAIAGSGAYLNLSGTQTVTGAKTFSGAVALPGGITGNTSFTNNVTIGGDLTVNGTTTTINSTVVSVDDLTFELGATASPTNATSDGGGLVLKATTDKSILWYNATSSWTSNQNFELTTGNVYRINGASVLSDTSLGSGVTASSLTSFGNSPTLVTPNIGAATATTVNNVTITQPATGSTLTIANGKTLTASNTLTFTGTDSSSVAFGTGGTVAYTSNNLGVFGATTSAQLLSVISDETGSGALVFATSPSLTTPALAGETFSTATITAGTNAQGQAALTADFNVITTAANNPSGATLPTATVGRRLLIVNRGANPVNVFPATGATIDGLAANASIALPVNQILEFYASSATQWYSSFNLNTVAGSTGVTSFSGGTTGLTPNTATTGAVTIGGILGVTNGGTGLSAASQGSVFVANTANTISALAGGGAIDSVLSYTASTNTIAWSNAIDGGTF